MTVAWLLSTSLFYSGVALALAGVGMFGWFFIGANAVAARTSKGSDTAFVWGGPKARRGLKVFAVGVLVHLSGYLLGAALSSLA